MDNIWNGNVMEGRENGKISNEVEVENEELRKKMIVRVCVFHGVRVLNYDALPEEVKLFYSLYKYVDIVAPLVLIEKGKNEDKSMGQLAIEFGLTVKQVEYILCCRKVFIISE